MPTPSSTGAEKAQKRCQEEFCDIVSRFVRRVHDEVTGEYGNDTRNDLWHGTSGTYAGLDRFGFDVGSGDPDCDTADQNPDGMVDPLDVGFILSRFGSCS